MLSKQMKGESIVHLRKYLKKKRKRPLSKDKIKEIEKLINDMEIYFKKMAIQIVNNPLFKLARIEIIREGKATIVKTRDKIRYEINPALILIKMLDIVKTTHKQGQMKLIDKYCE